MGARHARCKMKLGFMMALWQRSALAEISMRRVFNATRHRSDIRIAVTDEMINRRLAEDCGFEVVSHPNTPLSDKHNAGARALRGRVDALVVLGSDGWICDRLPDVWDAQLESAPVVGVIDTWQVCTHRWDALYYPGYPTRRRGEPMGAARGLRSDVLDALDWAPWAPGKDKSLDFSMLARIQAHPFAIRVQHQADYSVRVIGLKSPVGLTPFERLAAAPGARTVSRSAALAPFPADEIAQLDALTRWTINGGPRRVES
jgi:hypothetical protein